MKPTFDVILVGGGLANGLIALRLLEERADVRFILLEKSDRLGGQHTWSFHHSDVSVHQLRHLAPLVSKSWPGYDVFFPEYERSFSTSYHTICSERFHDHLLHKLGKAVQLNTDVQSVEPKQVRLANGEVITGRVVVDGRGWPSTARAVPSAYQKFVGQNLRLSEPHGLDRPVLMDNLCEQRDGFRFFYLLPWNEHELLVEDTRYSDTSEVFPGEYRAEIGRYVEGRGWKIAAILGEEQGSLPLPLGGRPPEWPPGIIASGLHAGLFNATTGYSLPEAVNYARLFCDRVGQDPEECRRYLLAHAEDCWQRHSFFRLLNRMMFRASGPEKRYKILQRFYRLSPSLVQNFYAGRLTWGDRIRILAGRPPVPLTRALQCLTEQG
jgi:lycopene beta-cyclase